jgi:signal transduction histidine kinase
MVWGLALLGTSLVLSTIAGSIFTHQQIEESTSELQLEIATTTARHIHSFIAHKIERLNDAAANMSVYPLGSNDQRIMALLLLKNDPNIMELAILDGEGTEKLKFSERQVYRTADLVTKRDSPHFRQAVQGDVYLGPVLTSARAEPYFIVALPVKSGPNTVDGVLVAQIHLKFLWDVVGESRFSRGGYAYLVDQNGVVIAHEDPSLVLKRRNVGDLPKIEQFLRHRSPDPTPGQTALGLQGSPVLTTYARVPQLGWAVVVEQPLDLALLSVRNLERYAVLFNAVGLLAGFTLIVWISGRISKPILKLRSDIEIIRNGRLDHRTDVKTGDEIEELADEFNKMTRALEDSHANLEEKIRQRTQEMSVLYEITKTVNESLELETILQAVIVKVCEIFKFECTRIFLFDDRMEQLELRACFELDPELWTGVRLFKRGEGIVGHVTETTQPMIFEDIRTDPRYSSLSQSKATHKAKLNFFAVFPIKTPLRVFGVILFNGQHPRKLTSDEVRLLTSISEHLGLAVEKSSLFGEIQKRSNQLSVLHSVSDALSQSLDLAFVLDKAVEKIKETLGCDAVWIYIVDSARKQLRMRGSRGLDEQSAQFMERRSITSGISGKICETGAPLVFEDVGNDSRYREISSGSKVTSLGFVTAAGFPIKVKEKVIGVLHLAHQKRRPFAPDELQLIESLAQEIGVAVENARLFEQVSQKTAELEETNRELRHANQAKSEFISAISHELRTPLNIIMGNAELAGGGFFGAINSAQKKSLRQIQENSHFLLRMVNNILTLSRIEANRLTLELAPVEIDKVISLAKSQAESLNRNPRLEISWDIDQHIDSIVTDGTKLEEILQNLIGNAIKFTPQGKIEVRVKQFSNEDRVEFTVADTGIGIEPGDLDRIFQAFEQINEAHTGPYNGVGLGLSIVKKYVHLMDGDIRVESELGRGSTFTVSLPRRLTRHSSASFSNSALLYDQPGKS